MNTIDSKSELSNRNLSMSKKVTRKLISHQFMKENLIRYITVYHRKKIETN